MASSPSKFLRAKALSSSAVVAPSVAGAALCVVVCSAAAQAIGPAPRVFYDEVHMTIAKPPSKSSGQAAPMQLAAAAAEARPVGFGGLLDELQDIFIEPDVPEEPEAVESADLPRPERSIEFNGLLDDPYADEVHMVLDQPEDVPPSEGLPEVQPAPVPRAPVAAAMPAPAPAASAAPPATRSTVVDLIQSLVQEGVLSQERATALIRQAEDEAVAVSRGQPAAMALAAGPRAPGEPAPSQVRVPYIPETVRRQIRDELRQDVVEQARAENWGADAAPEWARGLMVYGDMRVRGEMDLFDKRNSAFNPNFAALNAGSPFDLNNSAGTSPPLLNTTRDRQRARMRLRLGATFNISENFQAGVRLATGTTTNPATTNQTLGTSLNKTNFLVDAAYIHYRPAQGVHFVAGRFPNPFRSTDLVWDEDINFDGVAAQFNLPLIQGMRMFSSYGAFPIENTQLNYPDNTSLKQKSRDKWLYGAQFGLEYGQLPGTTGSIGAAYYRYTSVNGKTSSPCTAAAVADPCDTDLSRPGSQQQGNTLFAIRDLVPVGTNPPVFQYYGLASKFRQVNFTGRVDLGFFHPTRVVFDFDLVKNLGFKRSRIAALNPVNNRGPSPGGGAPGPFEGGGVGFQTRMTIGYPEILERWQWNITMAYKYLESDAVIDAFTESDFHLGGTNAKGYIFGGSLGLARNVNLTARWMSASEISGLPYTVDVVLVDLNAKF